MNFSLVAKKIFLSILRNPRWPPRWLPSGLVDIEIFVFFKYYTYTVVFGVKIYVFEGMELDSGVRNSIEAEKNDL